MEKLFKITVRNAKITIDLHDGGMFDEDSCVLSTDELNKFIYQAMSLKNGRIVTFTAGVWWKEKGLVVGHDLNKDNTVRYYHVSPLKNRKLCLCVKPEEIID